MHVFECLVLAVQTIRALQKEIERDMTQLQRLYEDGILKLLHSLIRSWSPDVRYWSYVVLECCARQVERAPLGEIVLSEDGTL